MADLADQCDKELLNDLKINQIRKAASEMPIGVEGNCQLCGYYFKRIVSGHCGRCRDELKLK